MEKGKPKRYGWIAVLLTTGIVFCLGYILIIPFGAPQRRTGKVHAQRVGTELRTALMNYFTEYKKMPPLPAGNDGDVMTDTSLNSPIITALMGREKENLPNEILNRRRVQFFTGRASKSPRKPGIWEAADGKLSLADPWGNPYIIKFDLNFDNMIKVPHRLSEGETEPLMTSVAVWSYGPNGVPGRGKSSRNDDVYAY